MASPYCLVKAAHGEFARGSLMCHDLFSSELKSIAINLFQLLLNHDSSMIIHSSQARMMLPPQSGFRIFRVLVRVYGEYSLELQD